jgi:ABC-type antimicrobial peptide transport system permease subunit
MAVGADGWRVMRLLMGEGIAPVLAGRVVGGLGSMGLSGFVGGFLFGIAPTDPATFATVAAILLAVALAAAWLPAREAAAVDPVNALNAE